ncbi:hypothetical protein K456DRAFT_1772562 [Colletotrichum gloeosporioides 23]|nr:hypothetical protein K456DRAFT_1772562 [Colletotrichum gloeosporioides 23]
MPEKDITSSPSVPALVINNDDRERQQVQETDATGLVRDRLQSLYDEHGATWDSPDDPNDPYNWSTCHKVTTAIVISTGQLITLMSTSVMASALPQISRDLRIDAATTQITFSLFVLGQAYAPFLIAALSEMYGRKPVWLISCCFYQLWNALCPVGKNKGIMIAGRFLAGCGASAGVVLTTPIMADMYRAEDRGKSQAIASLIPYFRRALGPIVGGLVANHVEWPWLFWILSMFSAGDIILGLFYIQETYTQVLLQRKRLQSEMVSSTEARRGGAAYRDLHVRLSKNMLRPLKLFVQRPVILVISWIWAISFGLYVLVLSSFATLCIERYAQSETQSTLNYIALAVGITISAPYMAIGVILLPAGLFWCGWAAERGMHWAFVDVGAAIFTCGTFITGSGIGAYLIDEFKHAASANAAARMLSNVLGFVFPIFAPQLFTTLGYGWGNSLLAFIFMVLGLPAPLVLWFWGERLRNLGKKSHE